MSDRPQEKRCTYCGTPCTENDRELYSDGRVHTADVCREYLKAALETYKHECAQMSEELGLPPTIRPAEGELRRLAEDAWKYRELCR